MSKGVRIVLVVLSTLLPQVLLGPGGIALGELIVGLRVPCCLGRVDVFEHLIHPLAVGLLPAEAPVDGEQVRDLGTRECGDRGRLSGIGELRE